MEPTRSQHATLNDLLDRILDKGILLNTDLIISVSGIPLIGINLKLALAGIETMLQYGIMADWDEAQRAIAAKEAQDKKPPIGKDEYIIFSTFGTHWYSKGIYECWRAGTIYVTNKRLFMFRKMPTEVLFDISYEQIKAMTMKERPHYTGVTRQELHLMLMDETVVPLHAKETIMLKEAIENLLQTKGLELEANIAIPDKNGPSEIFLQPEEAITNEGKLWYLVLQENTEGTSNQWKPGHLYFTDNRLCFWYDFNKSMILDIPTEKLVHVTIEENESGNTFVGEKSIIIMYSDGNKNKVGCFSGDESSLQQWKKVIDERISEQEDEKSIETCPRCGKKANRESLLKEGCSRCGWMSYRIKQN